MDRQISYTTLIGMHSTMHLMHRTYMYYIAMNAQSNIIILQHRKTCRYNIMHDHVAIEPHMVYVHA